jgi:hypothetical protein
MRQFVVATMLVGTVTSPAWAQPRGNTPSGGRPHACTLLTREVVMQFGTPEGKRFIDMIKPQEDELGATGSACEYGGINLQIDPFARAQEMRKDMGKEWTAMSGIGETAYFRNNSDRYAELIVWSGTHHFTIQMSVPDGLTADAIKPHTTALANAIIAKLR